LHFLPVAPGHVFLFLSAGRFYPLPDGGGDLRAQEGLDVDLSVLVETLRARPSLRVLLPGDSASRVPGWRLLRIFLLVFGSLP
jgi:hypothetical protein